MRDSEHDEMWEQAQRDYKEEMRRHALNLCEHNRDKDECPKCTENDLIYHIEKTDREG